MLPAPGGWWVGPNDRRGGRRHLSGSYRSLPHKCLCERGATNRRPRALWHDCFDCDPVVAGLREVVERIVCTRLVADCYVSGVCSHGELRRRVHGVPSPSSYDWTLQSLRASGVRDTPPVDTSLPGVAEPFRSRPPRACRGGPGTGAGPFLRTMVCGRPPVRAPTTGCRRSR